MSENKSNKLFKVLNEKLNFINKSFKIKGFEFKNKEYLVVLQTLFISISVILNLVLLLTISSLFPLKEKEYVFLTILPKERQVAIVEPFKINTTANRELSQLLAERYLILRETIMGSEQLDAQNLELTLALSSDEEKSRYATYYNANRENNPQKIAKEKGYTRSVEIITSQYINDSQIQVRFRIIDSNRSTQAIFNKRIMWATITFGYDAKYEYKVRNYINPYGFYVQDYVVNYENSNDMSDLENSISKKEIIERETEIKEAKAKNKEVPEFDTFAKKQKK